MLGWKGTFILYICKNVEQSQKPGPLCSASFFICLNTEKEHRTVDQLTTKKIDEVRASAQENFGIVWGH